MSCRTIWLDLVELDSPWPGPWLLGGDVPLDQAAVVAIRGTWEAWSATHMDPDALLQANAVTLGLCRMSPDQAHDVLPAALAACDLRVRIGATASQQLEQSIRQWNQDCDSEDQARGWVEAMAGRVHRHGPAALACARTIRLTARLTEGQGIVVESLTYAMLQAGAAHRQWLAGQSQ